MLRYFKLIRQFIDFFKNIGIDIDFDQLGRLGPAIGDFLDASSAEDKVNAFLLIGEIIASMTETDIDDRIVDGAKELAPVLIGLLDRFIGT